MNYLPYKTISSRPHIKYTSPGEQLWYGMRNLFIHSEHYGWDKEIFQAVSWAEPNGSLALFMSNVIISSVQYRLIKSAERFVKEICPENKDRREPHVESAVLSELRQYCVSRLGIGYHLKGTLETVTNLAYSSYLVTTNEISDRDAKIVCNQEMDRYGSIKCYICDDLLHSKLNHKVLTTIPLDHIWPRSLGGVSTTENLLPICEVCNGLKGDRISWDVYGVVQDTTHAINGTNSQALLQQALIRRAAVKLAEEKYLSLKEAFKELGVIQPLKKINNDEPRTFFNLEAHDSSVLESLWE